MGHYASHGICAFISVRAEGLSRARFSSRFERTLCSGVSDKSKFYVGGSGAVSKRGGGVKTAESSTKTLRGTAGRGGREIQGHIWGREHEINAIGIHGKRAIIEWQKKDIV